MKTLYKKTKNGQIQTWQIEVSGNKYRTIEGILNGKLTTSEWTIEKGRNIGKVNETTAEQQALIVASRKYQAKLESGYSESIENIGQGPKFLQPMLAHSYSGTLFESTFVQPKLDGIRCLGTRTGLFSRRGKEFVSCPHIAKIVFEILEKYPEIQAIDGELYNHKFRDNFNKITSLVKSTKNINFDETREFVQLHVYDLVISEKTFAERNSMILEIIKDFPYLEIVQTLKVSNHDELDKIYHVYLSEGYEGQMLRNGNSFYQHDRTKDLLKRKEFSDVECIILEITEGAGNRSGMAGHVKVQHPNGQIFQTNLKGTQEYFVELLKNKSEYIGKLATIRYQNLTPDGIPRFPVMISVRDYE